MIVRRISPLRRDRSDDLFHERYVDRLRLREAIRNDRVAVEFPASSFRGHSDVNGIHREQLCTYYERRAAPSGSVPRSLSKPSVTFVPLSHGESAFFNCGNAIGVWRIGKDLAEWCLRA